MHSNTKAQTTHSDNTLQGSEPLRKVMIGSFQGHKEGIRSANTQQARQDGDTSENASWKNSLACRTPNTSMLHLLPTAFCDAAQIDRYGS
jgi:hypothetical protein